jgi:hypothetical protein
LPGDPKPVIDGARINSPHYLCQLKVTEPGVQRYTLVVAQVCFRKWVLAKVLLIIVRENEDHLLLSPRL